MFGGGWVEHRAEIRGRWCEDSMIIERKLKIQFLSHTSHISRVQCHMLSMANILCRRGTLLSAQKVLLDSAGLECQVWELRLCPKWTGNPHTNCSLTGLEDTWRSFYFLEAIAILLEGTNLPGPALVKAAAKKIQIRDKVKKKLGG